MTELLRTPKDVVAQTEAGAVRISRRDAQDLILVRADELEAKERGIALAVKIARRALATNGDVKAALLTLYPWASLFSTEAMDDFAKETDRLVWAAVDLGSYRALAISFGSWQGTAEALADGWNADDDLKWTDDETMLDVERPA